MSSAAFPIPTETDTRPPEPPLTPPPPTVAAPAPSTPAKSTPAPAPVSETPVARDVPSSDTSERDDSVSDDWMLSVEGVTHAPVDLGLQLGLETPVGLRFFGGYGWVPSAYKNVMINAAVSATGDELARGLLEQSFDGGKLWRFQVGIRPFHSLGLYLDAGFARMKLSGSFDTAQVANVPGLTPATYAVESNLTLGSLELGYQGIIANHMVIALGVGVTKILSANTSVSQDGGSVSPDLSQATGTIDDQLVKYGVVPTLNLRLGLDLI